MPGPSRGTTTFNTPSNLTVPYGRFIGNVSGRGGSGNAPLASAWTTNYNTNYNVAYPIATQPIANRPANAWTTNYITNYNVAYVTNHHMHYYTYHNSPGFDVHRYTFQGPAGWAGPGPHFFAGTWGHCPSTWHISSPCCQQWGLYSCPPGSGGSNIAYGGHHVASTHAIYPTGNQPIANQPATAWTTNYSTNYSVAYPVANRPIANQPVSAYTPGNVGANTNVLGVTFPGGPIDLSGFGGSPGTAPTVNATPVSYYSYPDNATYPVAVPSGGQIVVNIS